MATLATIRSTVSAKLGLDPTANGADEVLTDRYANEAVRDILLRTSCYVADATANLTAGQADYDLDNAILKVVAWSWSDGGTVNVVPERVSAAELVQMRSSNVAVTGSLRYVAFAGFDQILIYPTPSSAATLTIYYVPVPTEMSDAAHDPSLATYGGIPLAFHKAIEWYVLWQQADTNDDQTSDSGERYRALYEQSIGRMRSETIRKGGQLGVARVGPRHSSRYGRHDNSIY